MKFGELVFQLRTKSRYSRRKLAGLADMDVSHLARLERGQVNPSLHMIIQLSVALQVEPTEFVKGLGEADLPETRRPYTFDVVMEEMRRRESG